VFQPVNSTALIVEAEEDKFVKTFELRKKEKNNES
jgi:hypothetical protein